MFWMRNKDDSFPIHTLIWRKSFGDEIWNLIVFMSIHVSHLKFTFQVKALKEKIEQEKGKDTFPAGGQKLIYAGKLVTVPLFCYDWGP